MTTHELNIPLLLLNGQISLPEENVPTIQSVALNLVNTALLIDLVKYTNSLDQKPI